MSPEKLILNCSQCGGPLEVTQDMELFKCEHCGMPYMVKRSQGSVQIVQLEQRVAQLEVKQTNLRRGTLEKEWRDLMRERERLVREYKSWQSEKATAVFKGSRGVRLAEALKGAFERALKVKQKYIGLGGSDPEILGMPNPVEIDESLKRAFPRYEVRLSLFGSNIWSEPEILVKRGLLSSARLICLPKGVKVITMSRSLKREMDSFLLARFGLAEE